MPEWVKLPGVSVTIPVSSSAVNVLDLVLYRSVDDP
jgi:hypothetical protein